MHDGLNGQTAHESSKLLNLTFPAFAHRFLPSRSANRKKCKAAGKKLRNVVISSSIAACTCGGFMLCNCATLCASASPEFTDQNRTKSFSAACEFSFWDRKVGWACVSKLISLRLRRKKVHAARVDLSPRADCNREKSWKRFSIRKLASTLADYFMTRISDGNHLEAINFISLSSIQRRAWQFSSHYLDVCKQNCRAIASGGRFYCKFTFKGLASLFEHLMDTSRTGSMKLKTRKDAATKNGAKDWCRAFLQLFLLTFQSE